MENEIIKRSKPWIIASGILAVVFYLRHDIVGAMNYPGYEWTKQAVSDLTATDAPSFAIARGISGIGGVCTCVCFALICVTLQNVRKSLKTGIYLLTIMHIVSTVGYSLFPLSGSGYDGSTQSFIHVYIVTPIVVLLSIVSLIFIAIGSLKDGRKALGIAAIAAFFLMFFGAVGSVNLPKSIFGIIERFSTYSATLFTAVFAVCMSSEK